MSLWLRIPIYLLSAYAVILLVLFIFQRRMVFYPRPLTPKDRQEAEHAGFTEYKPNKKHLGWIKKKPQAKINLVLFHGNASLASEQIEWMEPFDTPAVNLVYAEYPGYGASPGKPTAESIASQAKLLMKQLIDETELPVLLIGESLGSGTAARMAAEFQDHIKGLILLSPYTSFAELANYHYPYLLIANLVVRDRFETEKFLKQIDLPLLIIHSRGDRTIPEWMGEKLAKDYQPEADFLLIDQVGHDLPSRYDRQSHLWRSIQSFLEKHQITSLR